MDNLCGSKKYKPKNIPASYEANSTRYCNAPPTHKIFRLLYDDALHNLDQPIEFDELAVGSKMELMATDGEQDESFHSECP